MSFVLAIDQGTTSSRAIVFRSDISVAATAQQEFPQHFPASGWVEHVPEEIWATCLWAAKTALKKAGVTPSTDSNGSPLAGALKDAGQGVAGDAKNAALDKAKQKIHSLLHVP